MKQQPLPIRPLPSKPADRAEKVYGPDIVNGAGTLYKKPGYDPFR